MGAFLGWSSAWIETSSGLWWVRTRSSCLFLHLHLAEYGNVMAISYILVSFSTNGCQGDRALKVLSSTQAKSYHRQALNHCPSWRRSLFMSIPGGLSGLSCHLSQLKAWHFLHRQNSHMYSHVSASIVTLLSKAGRSLGSSIEARWIGGSSSFLSFLNCFEQSAVQFCQPGSLGWGVNRATGKPEFFRIQSLFMQIRLRFCHWPFRMICFQLLQIGNWSDSSLQRRWGPVQSRGWAMPVPGTLPISKVTTKQNILQILCKVLKEF